MRLEEYLQVTGLNPHRFAASVGIARATVERIMGGGGCTALTAQRIIRATHGLVTLDDVVGGEGEPDEAASA